jgi:hypothetical protein
MHYTLASDNSTVKKAESIEEWADWFEHADNRLLNQTQVRHSRVSTVFLGIDHSFDTTEESTPILFETMIFGGAYDQFQWRYTTAEEALEDHAKIVNYVMLGIDPSDI